MKQVLPQQTIRFGLITTAIIGENRLGRSGPGPELREVEREDFRAFLLPGVQPFLVTDCSTFRFGVYIMNGQFPWPRHPVHS